MNASKWDVSEEEYYSDELHESNSRLSVFRDSVPKYYAQFIEKSIDGKQSKSMDFGSAFHLALLQPHLFDKEVAIGPDINKNTTEYKTWKKEHSHQLILDSDQESAIQKMVAGVAKNNKAVELLNSAGSTEQAIRWQDNWTGIWCKCKVDYLLDQGIILDIKTCRDPSGVVFSTTCGQLDYECQAAFYKDGVFDLTGVRAPYYHIAVGVEAPYECIVYELNDEAIQLGRAKNDQTLRRLKDCRDSGVWDSPFAHCIVPLSLPRWSFNRSPAAG